MTFGIGSITLGELIRSLETEQQDARIYFDFCRQRPLGVGSWRGDYSELALAWGKGEYQHDDSASDKDPRVSTVVRWLREAIGKTYTGYKGGDYVMREHTPVWVDNYSECTSTEIIGVRGSGGDVVIVTRAGE